MPARLLIRDLAFADGTSPQLQLGIGLLVEAGQIAWIGPTEEADSTGADILDGGGATLVPTRPPAGAHGPSSNAGSGSPENTLIRTSSGRYRSPG